MGILNWFKETARGPVAWGAVFFSYFALLLIAGFVSYANTFERNRAISDFCTVQETQHKADVKQLKDTYEYLQFLPEDALKDRINQFILLRLPETEENAKTDVAPPICDEEHHTGLLQVLGVGRLENYGLDEPDPKLPERPEPVDRLYNEYQAKLAPQGNSERPDSP